MLRLGEGPHDGAALRPENRLSGVGIQKPFQLGQMPARLIVEIGGFIARPPVQGPHAQEAAITFSSPSWAEETRTVGPWLMSR